MNATSNSTDNQHHVLIIAYHFPPIGGSSGIQRTLKFTTYLREFGWEPMVLTVIPKAYDQISNGQMNEIPDNMVVARTFAIDSARHLAIAGRYLRSTAIPDRWVSWFPSGVWRGLQLIRKYRPAVILSTFPISTAHLIGLTLQRLTGVAWVADFRDNMTDPEYPPGRLNWRINRWIEAATVKYCSKAIFTTPGALEMYAERYPEIPSDRWAIIENGYDEENFIAAEQDYQPQPKSQDGLITLIHSGVLYPEERDPRPFFAALRQLKESGRISANSLRIVLRATASDHVYRTMLNDYNIADIVHLADSISYKDALQEMISVDGLLLFQAAMCNHQIPAKLYEYFRAGRPIFALTDLSGDTASTLRAAGINNIVNIADEHSIAEALSDFIDSVRSKKITGTPIEVAKRYSRKARTQELATLLNTLAQK